jgi:hypothetical protein
MVLLALSAWILVRTRIVLTESANRETFGVGMMAGAGGLVLAAIGGLLAFATIFLILLYRRCKAGEQLGPGSRTFLIVSMLPALCAIAVFIFVAIRLY